MSIKYEPIGTIESKHEHIKGSIYTNH